MKTVAALRLFASVALLSVTSSLGASAQDNAAASEMTFFITSVGSGNGADLGGMDGADRHCQDLAEAAGAGDHTWRAYLSASAAGGEAGVNARDRIGTGPWQNARGDMIAADIEGLHGTNDIGKETALTENGDAVNGRGDTPNMHDMLTGSQPDGTAFTGGGDMTCGNWTSSTDGAAMLGHHDRVGRDDTEAARSWNSSHASREGCSQEALRGTGGDGLFYCFASD